MESETDIIVFVRGLASENQVRCTSLPQINLIDISHPRGHSMICGYIGNDIYELQLFNSYELEAYGCWFINQRISSQKKFYFASKIDPRFLLLPFLLQQNSKFIPLDQLIPPGSPDSQISLQQAASWKLDEMCDINDKFDDLLLCRYNEEKVKSWLVGKVSRASEVFRKQRETRLLVSNTLSNSSFNISKQSQTTSSSSASTSAGVSKEDIVLSVQVIVDYLSESISKKLIEDWLNLQQSDIYPVKQATKRKADWEIEVELEQEANKFSKPSAARSQESAAIIEATSSASSTNPSVPKSKHATPANKKKAETAAKLAATMKPMSSFFAKKT